MSMPEDLREILKSVDVFRKKHNLIQVSIIALDRDWGNENEHYWRTSSNTAQKARDVIVEVRHGQSFRAWLGSGNAPDDAVEGVCEAIKLEIKNFADSATSHEEQALKQQEQGEQALQRAAALRLFVPSPLVALAQCAADDEDEIKEDTR